ncbi:hypothetical protein ABZ725_52055 [Streptomyces sp. NPDC006872]|uniref:hypothetical protein n=1 Tax=Streptomyces sp. NPDC006872 TaxID=3155720 RepID=UPI0033EF0FF7
MSHDTPPHMPAMPPPPPEPAAKKSRTNAIIISSAAAVIAAIVATGIVVTQSGDDDSEPTTAAGPSLYGMEGTAAAVAESSPETEMEPTYSDLDADDFTMELRTTSRQCFGSAGCNVTVEPELTYVGVFNGIDPDVVYEITYEIQGDESGPVIQTAELSNETRLNYRPSMISTASSGTKVSVEITDVATQGG